MKPAAAFSVGLWAGAAVVAAVGLFYVQGIDRGRSLMSPTANSDLIAKSEQIRLLEQENARLSAELQRLRETASMLKSNLEVKTTVPQPRRVPFMRVPPAAEVAPAEPAPDDWIEQAVAASDIEALPQLEEAAQKNNHRALEALALLADQDQAAALTRVWRSESLTPSNQADATRYLAATLEVNPLAEQLLRALATDPDTDMRVLSMALDGLANPAFPISFGRETSVPAPPHFKPDYSARLRVLDSLRAAVTDESFRVHADQARTELQTHWAEANP
jgi:hypothetical protein